LQGVVGPVTGLRWSLIEEDGGLFDPDDEPVYERDIPPVDIVGGVGTFSGQFILFRRGGKVAGVDESTGERPTHNMYVLIETAFFGEDLGQSPNFIAT
jgi:hypothetical protein